MAKREDMYQKAKKNVTMFLAGERDNPKICIIPYMAERLEKEFNIILEKRETVNEARRIFMYEIVEYLED